MKKRSEVYFKDDEKERIESAIRDAESRTSGEIAAMVVDSSDSYRDVDIFVSMVLSAFIAVYPAELVYMNAERIVRKLIPAMEWMTALPDSSGFMTGLISFIFFVLLLYLPARALFRALPAVKRLLIPVSRRDAEVMEKALAMFREQGLYRTRDATGMLFLVSLFERRVYILADHGIYAKIKQESLDAYAETVSRGMASGKGADALCEAISSAGNELAKFFPRRDDDVNELPDKVLSE